MGNTELQCREDAVGLRIIKWLKRYLLHPAIDDMCSQDDAMHDGRIHKYAKETPSHRMKRSFINL